MAKTPTQADTSAAETPPPMFYPSRPLALTDPLDWLRLGWQDFRHAPGLSLAYGGAFVLFGYLIIYLSISAQSYVLLFSLITGFVLVGPAIAVGLYAVSCQLGDNKRPTLGHCLAESRRTIPNVAMFALVLFIVLLLWARAASMVHVFFPMGPDTGLAEIASFLAIGSAVGAIFAALTFTVSAFSLPMIMDRDVDVITAVLTSINAVLNNKAAMAFWALLIVLCIGLGLATGLLGLVLALPIIGYATWHGYRHTITAPATNTD